MPDGGSEKNKMEESKMQTSWKRIIVTLAGAAAITAVVLLALFTMREAAPTAAVEMSQPQLQETTNMPYGAGTDELYRTVPTENPSGSQASPQRKLVQPDKTDAPQGPQAASLIVAAEENSGTDSFLSQDDAFDSNFHDNNTAGWLASSHETFESTQMAIREANSVSDSDTLILASLPVPPSAAAEGSANQYLSRRASELLTEIQREGAGLMRPAETLGTFSRNPRLSWQSHAYYLDKVKGHINAVGERTAELQGMSDAVLPWQQQAISEVTAHAAQIAASTQAAIVHLRENQNRLFVPEYRDHLTTIADRSEDMKQTVDKFLRYEKTQQELQQLQIELEIAGD